MSIQNASLDNNTIKARNRKLSHEQTMLCLKMNGWNLTKSPQFSENHLKHKFVAVDLGLPKMNLNTDFPRFFFSRYLPPQSYHEPSVTPGWVFWNPDEPLSDSSGGLHGWSHLRIQIGSFGQGPKNPAVGMGLRQQKVWLKEQVSQQKT